MDQVRENRTEIHDLEYQAVAARLREAGLEPALVDGFTPWFVGMMVLQLEIARRGFDPAPIGFYFAKLWYYEKLYPLVFAVAALGQAIRRAGPPPAHCTHGHGDTACGNTDNARGETDNAPASKPSRENDPGKANPSTHR